MPCWVYSTTSHWQKFQKNNNETKKVILDFSNKSQFLIATWKKNKTATISQRFRVAKIYINAGGRQSKKQFPKNFHRVKSKTRRPARTGIFFAQLQNFDQPLQTIENETTVLNLIFKGFFSQKAVSPLIPILQATEGVSRFSVPLNNFPLRVPKKLPGTLQYFKKFRVLKSFKQRKRDITSFFWDFFVSQY